jgi:glycosyltransferase involved in cell wall biosynthesis
VNARACTIGIDARKIRDYGIGRTIQGLLESFAAFDGEDRFVLFAFDSDPDSFPGDLPRLLKSPRFRLVKIDAPLYSAREIFAFRGAASRYGLDLFHFPHYVRAAAINCPIAVTVHDAIHLLEPHSLPERAYARAMMEWSVRSAALLFTVSESARSDLERVLPASRGRWNVVLNGIDLSRFKPPDEAQILRYRAARELPDEFALVVGSHRAHKNLPAAIQAFESAAPGATLYVTARDEAAARRMEPILRGASRTKALVPVRDDELPLLYAAARLVIAPSRLEGFGLQGLEALASGSAVLATPIPAHREILGDAAAYSKSTSTEDLAGSIAALWADETHLRDLRARGPVQAALFPWERSARRTLQLYREVALQRSPTAAVL